MNLGFLRDFLTWFASFAAFLVALGVVLKSPVGKGVAWVYRHLIGQPGADWMRHNINEVVIPHITALRAENTLQHAEGAERLKASEGRLTDAINDLDRRNTADHIVMKAGIAVAQEALTQVHQAAKVERADISQQITDQGGQSNGQTVDA